MNKTNRYVIYMDFNTKDWILYDNETNRNLVRFDTEKEAYDYLDELAD